MKVNRTPPASESTIEQELARHSIRKVTEVAVDMAREPVAPQDLLGLALRLRGACEGSDVHLLPLLEQIAATAVNLVWRCEMFYDGDSPPIPMTDWAPRKDSWQDEKEDKQDD